MSDVDARWNDPAYIGLNCARFMGDAGVRFVRRTTLAQLHNIERLRFRAASIIVRLYERRSALVAEISKHGGEAFVPVECYTAMLAKRDDVDDDDRNFFSKPRRIEVTRERFSGAFRDSYNDRYWDYVPNDIAAQHSVLGELAAVGDLRDWEVECARRLASITPKQFELGRRYHNIERRIASICDQKQLIEEMLELGVRLTGVVAPKDATASFRPVMVELNGRLYIFIAERGRVFARRDLWPWPGEPQVVSPPTAFRLDEGLVGHDMNTVRTRLGEPDSMMGKDIWIYGQTAVKFDTRLRVKRLFPVEQVADVRKSASANRSKSKSKSKSKTKAIGSAPCVTSSRII